MVEPSRAELKYLVERQREEIRTITEVGRLLSSTTDPPELIRLVAAYFHETFPVALCAVFLYDQQLLRLIQFTKIAQMDLAAATREIFAKASEHAHRPLAEDHVTKQLDDQSVAAGQWSQTPVGYLRSHHAAPLALEGRMFGLLSVFSGKADAFTKDDQHVIEIVADQLRAALRTGLLLDELRRANALKGDLLMVISHELRIPLTAIKEGIGLVVGESLGSVNAEQRDFLHTVNENADRLERLMEKVITTTQLLTGQLHYALTDTDLRVTLERLKAAFEPHAREKGVIFELVGTTAAITCSADAERLNQALAQLVENALHATDREGLVTIECTQTPTTVMLRVTDTGVGIPAEELSRLFEQFHFVGGVDDRKTGGLALGLFIAKTIITAHGGTIQLESQVGQGTRATVQLPKTRAA